MGGKAAVDWSRVEWVPVVVVWQGWSGRQIININSRTDDSSSCRCSAVLPPAVRDCAHHGSAAPESAVAELQGGGQGHPLREGTILPRKNTPLAGTLHGRRHQEGLEQGGPGFHGKPAGLPLLAFICKQAGLGDRDGVGGGDEGVREHKSLRDGPSGGRGSGGDGQLLDQLDRPLGRPSPYNQ